MISKVVELTSEPQNQASIDLGFIYNMTGIFTGPAIPPLVGTFFSSRQGTLAATSAVWVGFATSVTVWLTVAKREAGVLTVASTGAVDVRFSYLPLK